MSSSIQQSIDDLSIKKGTGQGLPPILDDKPFGNGNGSNGNHGSHKPIDNAILAMLLFIGAEVMFFAGLMGAFIVLKFGAIDWPPPGQPRLPVAITGINTLILLTSGFTMFRTLRLLNNRQTKLLRWLVYTLSLGIVFLLVQGFEWTRIIRFGLTFSSNIYGTVFYTIIGCHALHVLGAVIWLTIVALKLKRESLMYTAKWQVGIKLSGMYWFLVVALWPFLYGLVYFD